MEELAIMLNHVQDSYYGFVVAVLTYVKKKQSRYDTVKCFIEINPNATTSNILAYISEQADFYEETTYCSSWIKIINIGISFGWC